MFDAFEAGVQSTAEGCNAEDGYFYPRLIKQFKAFRETR